MQVGGDLPKENYETKQTEKCQIPIYSNGIGANALYGYTNIAKINKPCVTISARGTIGWCEYRDKPFYPIIRLICALPNEELLNAKYLKYLIQKTKFDVPTTGIPQLTTPMVSKYTISLPPLEKQKEIVEILDKFDMLVNDLSKGLPAENEAVQKQYEYYRNKLLNFKVKEI